MESTMGCWVVIVGEEVSGVPLKGQSTLEG